MARAHYAAQTQTVSHPSSSESARVAMPIIPPAPLMPETATFMFGGPRALMAIINDVADYTTSTDSLGQIVVTSTPRLNSEKSQSVLEVPTYPIEYELNVFILERINPIKGIYFNKEMVSIPRELKYFKGYLTESWKFNNLDFFTAIGGAQELVSSFRMGHLPHWTSDSYINKAQFAFCFSVSCIQRSLDILKNPASLTEI